MKVLVFAAAWLLAIPAWAQSGERLGVGDAIRVTVFQQPDLTTEVRVSEKGTVAMPLIGEQKVAGKSTGEAAKQIADALKNGKYLKDPQVSIAMVTLRSRQVSVLGQVARPGRYALDDTSSGLTEVLAAAGGVMPTGADSVTVVRDGQPQKVDVISKDFKLKNGDTVYIERAPVFYIYGEVTRAGAYRVEPNMTVMQAIAAGGGITPRGSDRRLKMRRNGADGKVVETDAKLQDMVKTDDVIYVKEALF
ncbi:MAG TPA: polysaccharide export protein EpsE [Burkholderiales bacterium]|nr:polysaccharide export protein EpsE [Burkholderiales bacterium]